MTRHIAAIAALMAALAVARGVRLQADPAKSRVEAGSHEVGGGARHHYTIGARVRPLVLFWITTNDVGDAVVTQQRAADEARYSLLIGTDPVRTPMHINRWGYIEEEIHGAEARLFGVMTDSDEESIEQAEANVRGQSSGSHPFKAIRATADAVETQARVASIHLQEDYTLRDKDTVLDLAARAVEGGRLRKVSLPAGTRAGFLAALADAMQTRSQQSIGYAYYGRLYDLRQVHTRRIPNLVLGKHEYGPAIAADFVITSVSDREQTKFSMTYGSAGPLAEVPLMVTYQPRWWMEIELTIDDARPTAADESSRP
jgi:hypothetical protein